MPGKVIKCSTSQIVTKCHLITKQFIIYTSCLRVIYVTCLGSTFDLYGIRSQKNSVIPPYSNTVRFLLYLTNSIGRKWTFGTHVIRSCTNWNRGKCSSSLLVGPWSNNLLNLCGSRRQTTNFSPVCSIFYLGGIKNTRTTAEGLGEQNSLLPLGLVFNVYCWDLSFVLGSIFIIRKTLKDKCRPEESIEL